MAAAIKMAVGMAKTASENSPQKRTKSALRNNLKRP
jgi:hypothetical protein